MPTPTRLQTILWITVATLLAAIVSLHAAGQSAGIQCDRLPAWSDGDLKVNLHHIFCGEKNRSGRAVGYHANPGGQTPSTLVSVGTKRQANAAGIATWNRITLNFKGEHLVKPLSTMFPETCSQGQVIASIVYASKHAKQTCASPSWAKCGPSAPSRGERRQYCLGRDGSVFTIATAEPRNGRINTGFPIAGAR